MWRKTYLRSRLSLLYRIAFSNTSMTSLANDSGSLYLRSSSFRYEQYDGSYRAQEGVFMWVACSRWDVYALKVARIGVFGF